MHPKDADAMANSVDPDQTASSEAVWSWSALFADTYLSQYIEFVRYTRFKDHYRIDSEEWVSSSIMSQSTMTWIFLRLSRIFTHSEINDILVWSSSITQPSYIIGQDGNGPFIFRVIA